MRAVNPVTTIVAVFGGQSAMARALDVSQGTVWGWLKEGRIPSKRIPKVIEAASKLPKPARLSPCNFFDLSEVAR